MQNVSGEKNSKHFIPAHNILVTKYPMVKGTLGYYCSNASYIGCHTMQAGVNM